jgi:hypothetical protein
VTYLPPKEVNTGIHLRLCVLRLVLNDLFTCVVYICDSLHVLSTLYHHLDFAT